MVCSFNLLKIFLMKDEAVTAIEYTLIALLIFVVIVEAVQLLGDKVLLLYDTVASVFPS